MSRLNELTINRRGFVFDQATGASFTTNEVGGRLLSLLQQGRDDDEITAIILSEYEVDEAELCADLDDFRAELCNLNLMGADK